jgi:hypothetical protein
MGLNLGLAFQLQDDYLDAFVIQTFGKTSRWRYYRKKKDLFVLKAMEFHSNSNYNGGADATTLLSNFGFRFINLELFMLSPTVSKVDRLSLCKFRAPLATRMNLVIMVMIFNMIIWFYNYTIFYLFSL